MNMNTVNGDVSFGRVRHDLGEDERSRPTSSSSGLTNDQKNPSTDPR